MPPRDGELRIKAQKLLDGLVRPGTCRESVAELLDAIVSDMLQSCVAAVTDAQKLAAAEERIGKLEADVRVLTLAVNSIMNTEPHLPAMKPAI